MQPVIELWELGVESWELGVGSWELGVERKTHGFYDLYDPVFKHCLRNEL